MILKKIKLHNFLIYNDVELDLSKIKLTSIVGQFVSDRRKSNGSGKTALLESIRYALYDQCRGSSKDSIVKIGEKSSYVELEFSVRGKTVNVKRSRNSDGTGSCKLEIDGKSSGDKVSVVNSQIESLIGIDSVLFDSIYFFKQNDQFAFAEASPSDRKNTLAKVFRMDNLVKCFEIAKQKKKDKDNALFAAKGAYEALGSLANSMAPYQSLVDQDWAISGNLANAQQILADYASFEQETVLSFKELEENEKLFQDEVARDLHEFQKVERELDESIRSAVEIQSRVQQSEAYISQSEQKLQTLRSQYKEYEGKNLYEEKKNFQDKLISVRLSIETERNKLSKLVAESEIYREKKLAVEGGTECPTCKQLVSPAHVNHVRESNRDKYSKFHPLIHEASSSLKDLQETEQSLRAVLENIERAISSIQVIESIDSEIRDRKKSHRALVGDSNKASELRAQNFKKRAELYSKIDEEEIKKALGRIARAKTSTDQLRKSASSRHALLQKEVETHISDHARLKAQLTARKKVDQDIAVAKEKKTALENECFIYDKVVEIFGKNGIQAIMIENAMEAIEAFANDILKQMHTRFVLELRTTKTNKDGSVKESLDVIVFDNGFEKKFEMYSGGEKAMINIALRLSLSKVISSLYGVEVKSLFLDEVLGALDEVNREEVVKIISFLSKSYEQVFVISHTPEVTDLIDDSIIVERYDDHSKIRISHGN